MFFFSWGSVFLVFHSSWWGRHEKQRFNRKPVQALSNPQCKYSDECNGFFFWMISPNPMILKPAIEMTVFTRFKLLQGLSGWKSLRSSMKMMKIEHFCIFYMQSTPHFVIGRSLDNPDCTRKKDFRCKKHVRFSFHTKNYTCSRF